MLSVDPVEIFSAKTVALLNRSAARDLYDISNLVKYELFDAQQKEMFKKCTIYYSAIASEAVPSHFDFGGIDSITPQKIKTDLTPVLRRAEHFNLPIVKKQVGAYLRATLLPEEYLSFWSSFAEGEYKPELLFDDPEIISRIKNHPMALWKCSKRKQ